MVVDSPPSAPHWQVPHLDRERRLLAGVGAGIAAELGVDPVVVRTGFVVLAVAGGWGVVLYGICWAWFAIGGAPPTVARTSKGRTSRARHLAIGTFVLGLLLLIRGQSVGFTDSLVWPTAALGLGFSFAWHHRPDDVTPADLLTEGGAGRWAAFRILAGLLLAVGGVAAALILNVDLTAARDVALAAVVLLAGLLLLVGPWVWRLITDLGNERRRRIRSEERSDLAAHLHDSVLQTLSLIQRNADDRATMVNLARRQERELRQWLYGEQHASGTRLRRALEAMATEVEELHGVPVEVVVVGDVEVDEDVDALIRSTREATTNAARHSGAERVDVYAEVSATNIDVFVRDTGQGFERADIADDRRGIADSIVGRMARRHGSATIHSEPGEGTEVELHLPLGRSERTEES